ncbi:hypothetical protein [Catellatospora sichuanensis]|uniref:hypothetical protein n=1 Tax=Catellatospora sichuanensis TaxID=1969805 RepID=UPI0011843CE6|nr:hypothetical protein [Catellatospora sichuanensis]
MSSATLFDGAWRLSPAYWHRQGSLDGGLTVTPVFDLPDGRSICWVHRWREQVSHWAVCRVAEVITEAGHGISVRNHEFADDPAEVWLYGTSLATLLEVALDNGGDIVSLRSGRLADLLHSRPAGES